MGVLDARDRRPTHAMPHVLQRALDPCVPQVGYWSGIRTTRRRISTSTPQRLACGIAVCPFARNELSMPPQQRVRSDNRHNLAQRATTHSDRVARRTGRRSPSVKRTRRRSSCCRSRRFSSIRQAIASRSRRLLPAVRTICCIWKAEGSITSGSLYHTGAAGPFTRRSAEF